MRQSSNCRRGEFRTRHQAVRAPRAEPVRSFGGHGGANGRGQRWPLSGDAAHASAPRALGDPDRVVTADTTVRRRTSCRVLVGRPTVGIDGGGYRPEPVGLTDPLRPSRRQPYVACCTKARDA